MGINRLEQSGGNGEAGISVAVLHDIEAHTASAGAEKRDQTLLVPFSSSFSS